MTIHNERNEDGCIFPHLVAVEELFEEAITNVTMMLNTLTLEDGNNYYAECDDTLAVTIPTSKATLEPFQVFHIYAL